MRKWITKTLESRPTIYNLLGSHREFKAHCKQISNQSYPATFLELQVASDLFFVNIDIYTVETCITVTPTRNISDKTISLWYMNENHVVALYKPEEV